MLLELLAPARNLECGKAAVDSGADALYIGGPAFGARADAANDIREVAQLAQYGRRFGVKCYLTLNTLLYPNELEAARRLAHQAWEAGCSALIIHDPALLELDLPPIPLFASTQMDNRTVEQVQRLERLGFGRVILARELSVQQIAHIRANTTVALESFVHGALCVCYSGRCYMSQHLTGRSANRGECAQPCRNRYDLEDARGRLLVRDQHLLSLKDLRLDRHLGALIGAGVSSFKIEGRLKNSGYVKNVVAHYRRCLDALMTQHTRAASLGLTECAFEPNPERTFSRGYTLYNTVHKRGKEATLTYAKARGQKIGTIAPLGKEFFVTLHPHVLLSAGDGVCYIDPNGQMTGSVVNTVAPATDPRQQIVTLQSAMPVGAHPTLYRSYDRLFEKALAHPRSVRRLITVALHVTIDSDLVTLQASIRNGPKVTLTLPGKGAPAKDPDLANQQIRNQLEKTAQNLYLFTLESLTNDPPQFFGASQINEWRRRLGQALLEASDRFFAPQPRTPTPPDPQALEELKQHIPPIHTTSPTLMQCRYCIKYELGWCGTESSKEPLWLVNQGKRFRLVFDCTRCEMKVLL
ncbi:MAG: U32 family peptidase [Bacteroidales bacterium]|nr:U32 family peptidase [Bacteroidales bacterium]